MANEPIKNRRTIVLSQSLATSNTFTLDVMQSVGFHPKYIIIRQALYCNIAGADSGIYLLWCSLTQSHVAAVYVGIQGNSHTPETVISIPDSSQPNISFSVTPANTAFTGPTGHIALTLEFIKDQI